MLGEGLLRYNKEQIFLILDFETCHLNLAIDNYPWQIAWIIATQSKIVARNNYYLNWGDKFKISKDAARVTGFDPELIKREGKDPREIYPLLKNDLENPKYIIVGQNLLNFDVYIENLWANEVGAEHSYDYINRLFDTNAIAKAIFKGIEPDRANFLSWQYKLMGYVEKGLKSNLGHLCRHYQIEVDENNLHKAHYDIFYNFEIFKKQIWEIAI